MIKQIPCILEKIDIQLLLTYNTYRNPFSRFKKQNGIDTQFYIINYWISITVNIT